MTQQNQYLFSHRKMNEITMHHHNQLNEEYRKELPSFFNIPEMHSQFYKKKISEIFSSFDHLSQFTEALQEKVDKLLKTQQNQFVRSYKQHMDKIQDQFKNLEGEVTKQKRLIQYYENEGKMSNLVQKVNLLEEESKKLYAVIEKKEKNLKDLKLQIKVLKEENKRQTQQTKEMMKNNIVKDIFNFSKQKKDESNEKNHDKFFTTQLQNQRSLKRQLSRTTDENKIGITYHFSENSYKGQSKLYFQKSKNLKVIQQLKEKNRKLVSFSSKIFESRNQLETLFIDSVQTIKKQIKIKRKIKDCSFQDFKKEDKLNLLLTIISNEHILMSVYEKLFRSKRASFIENQQRGESLNQTTNEDKLNRQHKEKKLPHISLYKS